MIFISSPQYELRVRAHGHHETSSMSAFMCETSQHRLSRSFTHPEPTVRSFTLLGEMVAMRHETSKDPKLSVPHSE